MKNKCYDCLINLSKLNQDKSMKGEDGNITWHYCKNCADKVRHKFFKHEEETFDCTVCSRPLLNCKCENG